MLPNFLPKKKKRWEAGGVVIEDPELIGSTQGIEDYPIDLPQLPEPTPFDIDPEKEMSLASLPNLVEQEDELESLSELGALAELKKHIANRPRRDQYKAGFGKTLLSGLAAALAGAATRDPVKGAKLGLEMRDRDFNRATEDWMMEGGKLKDLAAIEERSNLGKENARLRAEETKRREKDDSSDRELRIMEIQRRIDATNDSNEIKKLQLDQNKLYQDTLNEIRREGNAIRREGNETKKQEKVNAAGEKLKQRNAALQESLDTIEEIKDFIYSKDTLRSPENARDLFSALGGWDSGVKASGFAQSLGMDNPKASRLRSLVERLKTEFLYEKSGKAITKPEMDRLEKFIVTTSVKRPAEFASRLADFEKEVRAMIRNEDGTYGLEDEYEAWKKAKGLVKK